MAEVRRQNAEFPADLANGICEAIDSGRGVRAGQDLKTIYSEAMAELRPKYGHWVIFEHCLPFDVSRAYDEATHFRDPRIWTAERDQQMWLALES